MSEDEVETKDVMYKVSKRNMRSWYPGSVSRKVRYFSRPKYTSLESLKQTIRKYFGKETSQTVYVFWKDSNGTKIPINYDKELKAAQEIMTKECRCRNVNCSGCGIVEFSIKYYSGYYEYLGYDG